MTAADEPDRGLTDGPTDAPPRSEGEWCSIRRAAMLLGVDQKAIRGRIARGTIRTRPVPGSNHSQVWVPRWAIPADRPRDEPEGPPAPDPRDGQIAQLRELLTREQLRADRAESEASRWRKQYDERTEELTTALRVIAEVRGALADTARALAEARRPWWQRIRRRSEGRPRDGGG